MVCQVHELSSPKMNNVIIVGCTLCYFSRIMCHCRHVSCRVSIMCQVHQDVQPQHEQRHHSGLHPVLLEYSAAWNWRQHRVILARLLQILVSGKFPPTIPSLTSPLLLFPCLTRTLFCTILVNTQQEISQRKYGLDKTLKTYLSHLFIALRVYLSSERTIIYNARGRRRRRTRRRNKEKVRKSTLEDARSTVQ